MKHWFQHIFLVSLGPGSNWQLCDFHSLGINNVHIATNKVLLVVSLANTPCEVLIGRHLKWEENSIERLAQ